MCNGSQNRELSLLQVGHCVHPEAMVMRGHSWNKMKFPAIVALIKHPAQGYILFDTGYAKRFFDETRNFPNKLYRWLTPVSLCDKEQLIPQLNHMGIAAEDIKTIFISHFHADHISGLMDFPSSKYICSKEGYLSFVQRKGLRALIKGYLPGLMPDDFISRLRFIEDEASIKLKDAFSPFNLAYDIFNDGSCLAVPLPGHASGHVGLMVQDGDKLRFLVGDACWTEEAYTQGLRPNGLTRIIMNDMGQYYDTLDKLSRLYGNNREIYIIPSHCAKTWESWKSES
ncbi:MAG TPA: MBL fold metallo-hydrolase [Gammaproteobacteria bacterium]|nr:MBL fold metallo-hydrolase [Gammaproteobacteria bacterium]